MPRSFPDDLPALEEWDEGTFAGEDPGYRYDHRSKGHRIRVRDRGDAGFEVTLLDLEAEAGSGSVVIRGPATPDDAKNRDRIVEVFAGRERHDAPETDDWEVSSVER